jgi:hypothetical protein
MAQRELGFEVAPASSERAECEGAAQARFLAADRYDLFFGNQRLDRYLLQSGDGWVVRLGELLKGVDYGRFYPRYSGHGRKALHPRTLLGLIVYGTLVRRGSLRELERLARTDLGAMWLSAGHQPDHSTIGKFINLHAELLSDEFFVALVKELARRLKLGPGVLAGDGTVVEAASSHWVRLRREAAELQGASEVVQSSRRAVSTESGAVRQPLKNGLLRPAYKPLVLAHERGLIVGQHVESSSERAGLWPMLAQQARAFEARPGALLLDAGFMGLEVLGRLAEQEINVICPSGRTDGADWRRRGYARRFGKRDFSYDAALNRYRCPAGQELLAEYRARDRHGRQFVRYRASACANCELRERCTGSLKGRTLRRYAGEELKEAMEQVLAQPAARRVYRRRQAIVEPVFARLRGIQHLNRFRRRGLRGVRVEFALHCIAYNLGVVAVSLITSSAIAVFLSFPGPRRRPRLLALVIIPIRS